MGQGSFGRTVLAVDEGQPLKPLCVIKRFLPPNQNISNVEKAAELFRQEALRLQELGKHPFIPSLLTYVEQDNCQYLVQEFVDGLNLGQQLEQDGSFTEIQIRQLLNDLLPILQFVHNHQVIHRDIKPENIIRRRADGQLVLVDFGAAKLLAKDTIAKTGTLIGTVLYAAPEQIMGKAVFASDFYKKTGCGVWGVGCRGLNKNLLCGFKAQFKKRCFSRRFALLKTVSLLQSHVLKRGFPTPHTLPPKPATL